MSDIYVIIALSFREHSTLELMNKALSVRVIYSFMRILNIILPDSLEFSITKEKRINRYYLLTDISKYFFNISRKKTTFFFSFLPS